MSFSHRFLIIVILGLSISSSYADECQFYEGSKCECGKYLKVYFSYQ